MAHLFWYQYALIGMCFVWSGFARSGLGFGGTVLTLPFLLLIVNEPLLFMPAIAVQVLVFSGHLGSRLWRQRHAPTADADAGSIDWVYLRHALSIMIVPKLLGVLGLLTLPPRIMGGIIFVIVAVYAMSYILNRPFKSSNPKLDTVFLILGGYLSGTSLIGAPLLIAVFSTHVAARRLRDTLFVLWFVLVVIKMAALLFAGVDLQLIHQLWLLPCAALGHVLGLRFHDYIVKADPALFYRVLGWVLLLASAIGLFR